jgi:hypothetical protein
MSTYLAPPKMIFLCMVLLLSKSPSSQAATSELSNAMQLYLKSDFPAAIQLYSSIVRRNPGSEAAHLGLIRALWKEDDVEKAHQAAEAAMSLFPSSAPIQAASGDVWFRMGKMVEAQEAYQNAIQNDPSNARGFFGLAKVHRFNFNRKSCRLMGTKAYQLDPEDPEIILAYASDLPAAEKIPLLEKYLQLGVNELESDRSWAKDQIDHLKKVGDLKTWELRNPPKKAEIQLSECGYHECRNVSVLINGSRKVDLLLDTGSAGIVISRNSVNNLGLKIVGPTHIMGIGDSGRRRGDVALAKTVQIGPLEFFNCPLKITKEKWPWYGGILGIDMLSRFLVALNLEKNKLEVSPLPPISGKPFDEPESWMDLDRTIPAEQTSFIPAGKLNHLMMIPTVVNRSESVFFNLDTGVYKNVIDLLLARKVPGLKIAGAYEAISGAAKSYAVEPVSIQIGRYDQECYDLLALDLKRNSHTSGLEISGLIGHPMLRRFVIIINLRDGLINFQTHSDKTE